MREISIHRLRIVVAGRALTRDAARELGGAFASALPAKLAAMVAQHGTGARHLGSISVRVPPNGSAGSMAETAARAVGTQMTDRVPGVRR